MSLQLLHRIMLDEVRSIACARVIHSRAMELGFVLFIIISPDSIVEDGKLRSQRCLLWYWCFRARQRRF